MAVLLDLWYFRVELFEGGGDFQRDLSCQLDVGIGVEKQGHHQVFCMCQMDEIVLVVVVDSPDLGIRLGL